MVDGSCTLYTDHKPLQSLCNSRKSTPPMVLQQIQYWTLTLSMYEYTIKHRLGESISNTDAFSQLLLPDTPYTTSVSSDTILMLE